MSSPYNTPSPPPCLARTISSAMAPLTPAQSAAVDKKIRAALEKLSLHHISPTLVAPGTMEPVTIQHNEWYSDDSGFAEPTIKTEKATNWSTIDVGFFVPEQTLDQHTVLENGIIYYQDVWAFINAFRVLAEPTDEATIRTNLHLCLREKAYDWYITELNRAERQELRTQPLEGGWFRKLADRFSPSSEVAEHQLNYMGYGWGDVIAENPVTTWAHTVLRHMQTLDYGVNLEWHIETEHLEQIWKSLIDDFAKDVPMPDNGTSVASFMADLDEAYKRWRWVVLTGPKNYKPREPQVQKSNGTVNGFGTDE